MPNDPLGREQDHPPCRLVLADGTVFEGKAIGAAGTAVGEAVFTTGMTGYQEVITDPSYCGQIVTMTATQIGNTGTNAQDPETRKPAIAGFVVHELSPLVSNWRATNSLDEYLRKHGIIGISNIDTRRLTRTIRDRGAQMAAIGTQPAKDLHDIAKAAPPMEGRNLVDQVSTREVFSWSEDLGTWKLGPTPTDRADRRLHVVAMDFGTKLNILRCLVDVGCQVTVVPSNASANQVLSHNPDGVFLSNGPGDPAAVTQAVSSVEQLLGKVPIFGICLGHQILSQALGASTYKLKFGHHGLNQPVKDLTTGKVEITAQNHGFCVHPESLVRETKVTHIHLNDDTCEGIENLDANAFSVQYHPEAAAGPHDSFYLFERFVDRMTR